MHHAEANPTTAETANRQRMSPDSVPIPDLRRTSRSDLVPIPDLRRRDRTGWETEQGQGGRGASDESIHRHEHPFPSQVGFKGRCASTVCQPFGQPLRQGDVHDARDSLWILVGVNHDEPLRLGSSSPQEAVTDFSVKLQVLRLDPV